MLGAILPLAEQKVDGNRIAFTYKCCLGKSCVKNKKRQKGGLSSMLCF
jgi:hypothetical protein